MSIWADLLGCEIYHTGSRGQTRVIAAGSRDADVVVLLHGQGGHAENFRHNIAAYASVFRVLAPDFLWHGLSATPPFDGELIPALVDQIADLLAAENVQACHIEGQSMGGWVATRLAIDRPDLVRSLVLTTPMGLDAGAAPKLDADGSAADLAKQMRALDEPSTTNLRARMRGLFADDAALDDDIVELRRAIYTRPATNAALRAVAESYFGGGVDRHRIGPDSLAALHMPVLVYWGTANSPPPADGQALAAVIPGARYHCSAAGHWAQYECAAEHNDVVLRFLTANAPSSVGGVTGARRAD